jgi:GNAT superfamily N-acetyltransferase
VVNAYRRRLGRPRLLAEGEASESELGGLGWHHVGWAIPGVGQMDEEDTLDDRGASLVAADERHQALDVLVSAFTEDPVIRWLYHDESAYLAHFPAFLMAFGGKAFDAGTVWRLGAFTAVALWFPPHLEPDDAVLGVIEATVPADQHQDVFAVLGQMEVAHPTYPHWYLPWFGVESSQQGFGLGSELMRQCLDTVDADHLPAYLESPNARNLTFYERHGFQVTGAAQEGACPPVYSMVRTPR